MSETQFSVEATRFETPDGGPIACTPTADVAVPPPIQLRNDGPALGPLQFRSTADDPVVITELQYAGADSGWFDWLLGGVLAVGGVAAADEHTDDLEDARMTRREIVASVALLAGASASAGRVRTDESLASIEFGRNPGVEFALVEEMGQVLGDGSLKVVDGGDLDDLTADSPATIPAGTTSVRVVDADDGLLPDTDLPNPVERADALLDDFRAWIDRRIDRALD